jgi:MFS family permease
VAASSGSFSSLASRDFRLYWFALIVSAVGTWMQIVAQGLLVLKLANGNPGALGFVALAQALAFFLFAFLGGGVADRFERRRLLLVTQLILMAVTLATGILVAMHLIQVWMLVAAAFLSGSVLSFDQPARSAFLSSLVPAEQLPSAVSLQSTVFTTGGAIAPVLAGIAIHFNGFAGNFFWNAASYGVVFCVLLLIRSNVQQADVGRPARPIRESIAEATSAIRKDQAMFWLISGYALFLCVAPSQQIFLPVLAARVLGVSATLLGLLFAAFGTGSILGALLTPRMSTRASLTNFYIAGFAVWACAMAGVALTRQFAIDLLLLAMLGFATGAITAFTITLLQSRFPAAMRGRMMSVQTLLNMGVRPLGDYPLALLMAGIGLPLTAGLCAGVLGAYTLYLTARRDSD